MKLTKIKFILILESLDPKLKTYFDYCDTCNDPCSHQKFQPKSAKYAFYLYNGEREILIEDGSFYSMTHKEKEESLIKKYTKWFMEWKKHKKLCTTQKEH